MQTRFGSRVPLWRMCTLVAFGALALFVVGAGAATDSHVGCGDTITTDTKLDSDLIDCPGDGLVIGADNITLDLNGHLIDGCCAPSYGGTGVNNRAGYDGVTITGGVVREFRQGVSLWDANRNTIRRMAVTTTGGGISLVDGSAENLIRQNVIQASAIGVLVEAGPGNWVQGNTVSGAHYGVYVSGQADGTRIERNSLSDNYTGILLTDSFGEALVAGNVVSDNCAGIVLFETQHSRIEKNTVFRSGGSCEFPVTGNGYEGDGIFASYDCGENGIEHNVANQNLDDGIQVDAAVIVARNRANENGDLGIEATPEVIDGGGNRARGNGNPLQCVNVVCSGGHD